MAITSESQIIDITTISNGCSIIEEAARDYATCSKKVKEAASICTDKALSVEKKSMLPLGAGLGAATLAGIGTKAYLDKREKKEEDEEDLEMESWAEEPEVEIDYGIETNDESDYLSPTDEFAFQE